MAKSKKTKSTVAPKPVSDNAVPVNNIDFHYIQNNFNSKKQSWRKLAEVDNSVSDSDAATILFSKIRYGLVSAKDL